MNFITLAVTPGALAQVQAGHSAQSQLAVQGACAPMLAAIAVARANNTVNVALGGGIVLCVGDTHAIWRVHQTGPQLADFDDLFSLLSRRSTVNCPA